MKKFDVFEGFTEYENSETNKFYPEIVHCKELSNLTLVQLDEIATLMLMSYKTGVLHGKEDREVK